ncbi:hypothetical protein [uncultured Jatrophihabitans sp.]|uniref:hypothetical protein n=1 Tax=uncultured Jatrophihabitans sp. TaxID=1610747 RepID=UPI0035C964AE
MDEHVAQLLAVVHDRAALTDARDAAWSELFEYDALIASSAAFDLLAGEPRIKPSRALVVDPGDTARRHWEARVAAAAALLASPVVVQLFDELRDELAEDADLAADVFTTATPHPGLTAQHFAVLRTLGWQRADRSSARQLGQPFVEGHDTPGGVAPGEQAVAGHLATGDSGQS